MARLLVSVISPSASSIASSTMLRPAPGMTMSSGISWPIMARSVETGWPLIETRTSTWPRFAAGGDDAVGHLQRLADEAEARRVLEADAAVLLALVAGDQRVQRRLEILGRGRHVVDLAVGDHDGAGDARGRHVAEGAFQRAEQPGLGALVGGVGAAGLDHAHVELLEAREPLLQAGEGCAGLGLAVADVLALAAVDDQRHDAFQRLALLVEQHRVDQRRGKGCERGEAEDRAALAEATGRRAPAARSAPARRQAAARTEAVRRRSTSSCYCPSRSSSTGTCTWSDL